ncbi:MAG: hypothetical protein D6762_02945 [Candidatus Neomarinimicrobiota bacterium]|nr:MAG: hypothetical protein D6762_02945 [Candidatus Neomarinimicrobiota bacterium]
MIIYSSDYELPDYPPNLAALIQSNANRFQDHIVFQDRIQGEFSRLSWSTFYQDICRLQSGLRRLGLQTGDRVAILSRNRREMLEIEMALMTMGAIAVPIFAGYPPAQADRLTHFCDPVAVVVADGAQYAKLDTPESFPTIIHFDDLLAKEPNLVSFADLLKEPAEADIAGLDVNPDTICLMMYTSGTMGKPKCVQLTHGNILSQQAAMRVLWQLSEFDRILAYLPWHHSFGGIFEKYAALYNGATLSLEHGFGKDIRILLDNWEAVKPTVFFSVPKIYQELVARMLQAPRLEEVIFHPELRFIFTAAAPLPKNISKHFEERNIPVYEGWGLTETSPCCTVTDPTIPRVPGIVGKPIPGVEIALAQDGEILVRGPNVMKGYYKNPEETERVLIRDGWFRTGDVGTYTEAGLQLISRKDRIFKLSNAEKVIPTEIENVISEDCLFLTHAYLAGSGRDYPVVLLFPNKTLLDNLPEESKLKEGCACPRSLEEFSHCLSHCLSELNRELEVKYARPRAAMLLDHELSIENEELTPSMKLAPNVVGRAFKANIDYLYGEGPAPDEKVYVIQLEH